MIAGTIALVPYLFALLLIVHGIGSATSPKAMWRLSEGLKWLSEDSWFRSTEPSGFAETFSRIIGVASIALGIFLLARLYYSNGGHWPAIF